MQPWMQTSVDTHHVQTTHTKVVAQKATNPSTDYGTADECLLQNTNCKQEHNRGLFATVALAGLT
jgi:hypothetical protein